ncbi:MAG: M6 family metalloprotease domain-containing protein [Muribaculaceae bacterium]|nr:M6 family metalloprotease domain-containing protein [Muribaculaceae bacterium]
MNKNLFILMFCLCMGLIAQAVPAKPGWHTVTQSDGSTLQVQAAGNAFNNALLTRDGLTVARGSDGDFYYISSVTGLTTVRAHEVDQRSGSENAFINVQRGSLTMTNKPYIMPREKGKLGVGGSNAEAGVPALGQRRIPIILVEFKDKKFNNTRQDIIDAMLTGNESVGQYFRDQSNGMYKPDFEVFGIYTLSQNREYYGGHQGNDNDKGLGWLVTEACQLATADGVAFSPYDTNNDDYCDVVIVIYAGVGEAQASWIHPEAVWPCNWSLSAAYYYGSGGNGAFRPSSGDPIVDNFAVFNELYGSNDNGTTIDGIGTFAHEFGHCLGLPDFYDTGDGDHYGLGDWDIMCMGCYNNDGFTPPGYSAYEKNFMGWIELITPNPGTYYTLPVWNQKNASTDKALCITSDLNSNEFFILENRKKQGWDRYAPGEGIMITHVTYNADRWWGDSPNNEDIQLMTLMNADNSWSYYDEATDLWPQNGKTEFTDTSTPAAKLNMNSRGAITGRAGYLGKPVTDMVINQDGTASFWYMKGSVTTPTITVTADAIDCGDVMMTASGDQTIKVFGQALTGNISVTLDDPSGVFSVNTAVITSADASTGKEVTVTFTPAAIQDYSATLTLSSLGAQDVVIPVTGHGLIEGYAPVMLAADEAYISLTDFRADWTDITPAQNVASYTLEVSPKPVVDLLETADFSNVPDVLTEDGQALDDISGNYGDYLPEGWSATSYLGAYGGALLVAYEGTISTPAYNLTGYDKMTVVIRAASYYYDNSTISVSTSIDSQELTLNQSWTEYTIVLDCANWDKATIRSLTDYSSIRQVTVYAGDLTALSYKATETGDATYRLITGITDKFYTVRNLEAEGSFIYKVKSVFADGTESPWSNVQQVTLTGSGHDYATGDVNHDGKVTITDVTDLIDYLLNSASECCVICADVDGDGKVSITDVTELIDKLLTRS